MSAHCGLTKRAYGGKYTVCTICEASLFPEISGGFLMESAAAPRLLRCKVEN